MQPAEYYQGERDFRERFLVYGNEPLRGVDQWINYPQLVALVESVEAPRFVVVHFGLEYNSLIYAFSVVRGDEAVVQEGQPARFDYLGSIEEPTHVLVEKDLLKISDLGLDWSARRQLYMDTMRAKRADTWLKWTDVDELRVAFPWDEEVKAMYLQNAKLPSETYRLGINSVSLHQPEVVADDGKKSPAGYRHGVAFFTAFKSAGPFVPMLRDGNTVSVYYYKASDYGNMCPVRCRYYEQRQAR
ncbi:MAG: hypothetical protein H6591_05655 [Flavobacteriales bacterium]|nr:hypothetical protein [Flavobacteriales bacterium]